MKSLIAAALLGVLGGWKASPAPEKKPTSTIHTMYSSGGKNWPLETILTLTGGQIERVFGYWESGILFEGTAQELTVLYDDGSVTPSRLVADEFSLKNPRSANPAAPANWKTKAGLHTGMSLDSVQALNGHPIIMTFHGNDLVVANYNGGNLPSYVNVVYEKKNIALAIRMEKESRENSSVISRIRQLPLLTLPLNCDQDLGYGESLPSMINSPDGSEGDERFERKLYGLLPDTTNVYAVVWHMPANWSVAGILGSYAVTTIEKHTLQPIATASIEVYHQIDEFGSDCTVTETRTTTINADWSYYSEYNADIECVDIRLWGEMKLKAFFNP